MQRERERILFVTTVRCTFLLIFTKNFKKKNFTDFLVFLNFFSYFFVLM